MKTDLSFDYPGGNVHKIGWLATTAMYIEIAGSAVADFVWRRQYAFKFIIAVALVFICYPRAAAGGQNSQLLGAFALTAMLYAAWIAYLAVMTLIEFGRSKPIINQPAHPKDELWL